MFIGAIGAFFNAIAHGVSIHAAPVLATEGIAGASYERTSLGGFVRFILAVHHSIAQLMRLDALATVALPFVVVAHFSPVTEE